MPRKPSTTTRAATAARLAARHDGFTPDRQRRFLERLAETASVRQAAMLAGVSRATVYRLRNDPEAHDFRAGWEEAIARAMDTLTDIAFDRAVNGTEEPIWYRGEEIGRRYRVSDTLLMYLMSRRQFFQPRSVASDRTVVRDHDEGSFTHALDRIAPLAPLDPVCAYADRPAPPAGDDGGARGAGYGGGQRDAPLSLSSLLPAPAGSTRPARDGMDDADEGDDLA